MSNGTVAHIKGNRDIILEAWSSNCSCERERVKRATDNDEINSIVFIFWTRERKIPVSWHMLQEKTLTVAASVSWHGLKASNA